MAFTQFDPYLMAAVDAMFAMLPRRRPSAAALQTARVYSHRGERDDREILEDTFAAYDPLLDSGVCGIECDVRFSRDGVPMVFHDATLHRLYGCHERLADLGHADLQARFPRIPTLAELVRRYAGKLELMIEFKAEPRADPAAGLQAVQQALAPLQPVRDYHVMSLDIETLDWLGGLAHECRIPIARANVRTMSDYAGQQKCAGFTGHYALLPPAAMALHRHAGRPVGVGFPESRNALFFALNRGARWIFSNRALHLQMLLDQARAASRNSKTS